MILRTETGIKLISNYKKKLEKLGVDTAKEIKGNSEYRGYDESGKKIKVEFPSAKSFSTHNLRHTFATNCFDKGMKLHNLRAQLGDSNIAITSQYLHLTKKAKATIQDIMG